ncbi:MAG: hypothetical protein HKP45_06535 [Winogradskyella sp.]|nr:hypothetical protein [Winogradskyella sp.]
MFTFANAQVDKEKKSIKIPAEQSQKEKDSSPQKIKVEPKKLPDISKESGGTINGISTKGFNKYKIKESDNNFSMVFDDGLRNPGEIFEKRWKKDAAKTGMIRTMSDQFLGEHRTNTKFVNIVCRDHEYPDGDRVRIFLNDEIVHPEILLTGSY